ncbi:ABC transporter ATP-binding protein [Bradyrhizobium sp. WD16]|uniref:ABC transporter ATP-binding protein n=1 Tax=Bradyrhizobium sp. WD16 TaxID=1521768 RepID=UPI0020A50314|nr:ABC transporter ATP-binding protein [Bradyrhizobium sp. WD16]UTD30078.1 ABC transporter ATP-binding protein [Bradyrhizobium sp. WD16]
MLLEVQKLAAGYGTSQVLFGVSLAIGEGEVVTLLGRNGMGKTSTVRCLSGLLPAQSGTITFAGERIDNQRSHRIARLGLGLVPEGRHIFPNLTVRENLLMAQANPRAARDPWSLERVLDFFPRLGARLTNGGAQLSGGEQQMLAIGRALMTNPRLLVLDEATEGLAPVIRDEIWARLKALKAQGLAMLIVDKEIDVLVEFADRHYAIEKGEVAWSGGSADLLANEDIRSKYLGL